MRQAISFFIRPTMYCWRCGHAVQQEINADEPIARMVWCHNARCTQVNMRAIVHEHQLPFMSLDEHRQWDVSMTIDDAGKPTKQPPPLTIEDA